MLLAKLKDILLYGTSFKLRPHEQATLAAWRGRLPADGRALLDAQLNHLVSYQRQAGGKVLVFFTLGNRPYPGVPPEILFPCKLGSCAVARVHLAGFDRRGTPNSIKADVQLHKGRLISFVFDQLPGRKLACDVETTKVDILCDPMIPASEETVSDAQRRKQVLKSIHSKLPDEYLQLVGEGKAVSINGWEVCAVKDIHKIPQCDGNYYVLAVKDGMGIVAVKEDESSGQLYYLHNDSHVGERINVGLRTFLQEFDGGKVIGTF